MPNQPPDQLSKPLFGDSDNVSPALQAFLSQLTDTVNAHSGYSGPVSLANSLDLGGKKISNVGAAEDDNDVLTSGLAQTKYSVQVLGPQLESSSPTGLKSMRRVNDTNQREQSSSYMNDLMSAVPNANQIFPLVSNSGGMVQVVIPASLFTWADGSTLMLVSRTDLLSLPAQFAISSISSSGNIISVATATASGLSAGQAATIAGVTPASFDGAYQIQSATPPYGLTFYGSLGTLSGSGGFVQANGTYYYCVKKRDPTVHLLGPFPSDTMQNRLQANYDNFQIVAVVVITNSGGQVEQSGGGGSPIMGSPTAGSFF